MKRLFILLICIFIWAGKSFAQTSYKTELLAYQDKYKKDLFPIIQSDTAFVKFYPISSGFRVTAKVKLIAGHSFFPMSTSTKSSKEATKYALVTFKLNGKDYQLYAYQLQQLL